MNEYAVKVTNITKQYRLGTIGGGTLRGDLQSAFAHMRGKEDPNTRLGSKQYGKNETLLALDDISFNVMPGEAIGIIGHNGAGKSTLLKILSRVTAPTKGEIEINGRIASMLEVGTGFHPELTGRENVYLNGAILGMTKAEIKSKFDRIVEFAEMERFIDTPVKRYSSGMYVKLAFSVAAHLDSEIMVMDEVLAVGDMNFQRKCLGKMSDAADKEGKTILYVSHNMNTIRQLCSRCIVLDHGKKIFDGGTNEAIELYSEKSKSDLQTFNDFSKYNRKHQYIDGKQKIESIELLDVNQASYKAAEPIKLRIKFTSAIQADNLCFRVTLYNLDTPVGMSTTTPSIKTSIGENSITLIYRVNVSPGIYKARTALYTVNEFGADTLHDVLECGFSFSVEDNLSLTNNMLWNQRKWGGTVFPLIEMPGYNDD